MLQVVDKICKATSCQSYNVLNLDFSVWCEHNAAYIASNMKLLFLYTIIITIISISIASIKDIFKQQFMRTFLFIAHYNFLSVYQ